MHADNQADKHTDTSTIPLKDLYVGFAHIPISSIMPVGRSDTTNFKSTPSFLKFSNAWPLPKLLHHALSYTKNVFVAGP